MPWPLLALTASVAAGMAAEKVEQPADAAKNEVSLVLANHCGRAMCTMSVPSGM